MAAEGLPFLNFHFLAAESDPLPDLYRDIDTGHGSNLLDLPVIKTGVQRLRKSIPVPGHDLQNNRVKRQYDLFPCFLLSERDALFPSMVMRLPVPNFMKSSVNTASRRQPFINGSVKGHLKIHLKYENT